MLKRQQVSSNIPHQSIPRPILIHIKYEYIIEMAFISESSSNPTIFIDYMNSVNITTPTCVKIAIHHHEAVSTPSLPIKRASQHYVII